MNNCSINFKGVFNVDYNKNSDQAEYETYDLADETEAKGKGKVSFSDVCDLNYISYFVDDDYDKSIEAFLKSRGIKFTKFKKEELCKEDSIKKRIYPPTYRGKDSLKIVYVKPEKFYEAYKNSMQYLGEYPNMDHAGKYDSFREHLATGQPILASEVYVSETGKLSFQDGRHRYAVLNDMNFSSIPIAMNKTSIKYAKENGLLAE